LTVQYVSYTNIQAHLNASVASGGTGLVYTVFGLSVAQAAFEAHVDYANLYINSIVGQDLDVTSPRYNFAKMSAINLACLRVLVAASGGMLIGAFDYRLGNLYMTRASVGRLAFEGAVQGFKDDLLRMLVNFAKPAVAAEASAKGDVPQYRGSLVNP
jgi:hypothetical protein